MGTKLVIVLYTNEMGYDLIDLTLPYLIKNVEHLNSDIWVVSNRIPKEDRVPGVNYFDGGVNFEI